MPETNTHRVSSSSLLHSPAELSCKASTLLLARHSLKPGHTLYNCFKTPMTKRRFKSRKPLVIEAQGLLAQNTRASTWIRYTWKENWTKNITRLHSFVTDVEPLPTGDEISRLAWVRLNRFHTGIGRFESLMTGTDNNRSM